MKNLLKLMMIMLSCAIFFSLTMPAFAQTGKITGKVVDKQSGEALPGANISLKGTSLGAATNLEGEFIITTAAAGNYTVNVTYIGYERVTTEVQVQYNRTSELNIEMIPIVMKGQEVIVTAQAEAQMQAINQQLAAKTIKNIVSKKQIQELPESNAAEAVGRLPGVALTREGGEGTKVVIRGMAPKYSKVQIEGVNMAATDSLDRSSDLSMISPHMLNGIEVSKSIMADQEGDATGGIVNFRILGASQDKKYSFGAVSEGGYNSLAEAYGNYKFSVNGSNRFLDNKLGLYALLNFEKKITDSDQFDAGFSLNPGDPVATNNVNLRDINRKLNRYGGTLVLDYSLKQTKFRLFSFTSYIDRESQNFGMSHDLLNANFGRTLNYTENATLTTVNALKFEHNFGPILLETGASYSLAERKTPEQWAMSTQLLSAQRPWPDSVGFIQNRWDFDPYDVPNVVDRVPQMKLNYMSSTTSHTREAEYAYDLAATYSKTISRNIDFDLKVGGRIKHKDKKLDESRIGNHVGTGGPRHMAFRNMIIDLFRDELSQRNIDQYNQSGGIGLYYDDFYNPDHTIDNFLGDRYNVGLLPDYDMFQKIHDAAKEQKRYYSDVVSTLENDYWGTENYWAAYVLPTVNIAQQFSIIPGVRYENNRTEYTGMRMDVRGRSNAWAAQPVDTVTKVRNNDYWLPMMHLLWKPTEWLNVRGGFVKTLQRPNYWDLIPSYKIDRTYTNWRNFRAKPERATNYDIQVSLFTNEIGLFSVGYFYKNIKDMLFWTGQQSIINPKDFELPDNQRYRTTAFVRNNEYDVKDYGYEIEWRSNFWWLPGLLNGLVLNVNYTQNISEGHYNEPRFISEYDENFNLILTNNDTTYTAPMIGQPDHLLNFIAGYDYKGFSIRYALRFKSNIFARNDYWEKLRGYSTDFLRHDISMQQKLPIEGLELFFNFYNLTNEFEYDIINSNSFTSQEEHYGQQIYLGIRFTFN